MRASKGGAQRSARSDVRNGRHPASSPLPGSGTPGRSQCPFPSPHVGYIEKKKLGATPPRGCSSRSPTRGACPASRRTPARAAITSSAALAARPPPAWWCVSSWLSLAWPLASSLAAGGGWWLVAAAANSNANQTPAMPHVPPGSARAAHSKHRASPPPGCASGGPSRSRPEASHSGPSI